MQKLAAIFAAINVSIASCASHSSVDASVRERGAAAIGLGSDHLRAHAAAIDLKNSFARVERCMKSKGFIFLIPLKPAARVGPGSSTLRNFRLTHGYGMADELERRRSAPARPEDPNQAYRAALGSSDREAYDQAVAGRDGCFSQGMSGDSKTQTIRTRLTDAREGMESQIATDDLVIRLESKWSMCMRQLGYTVSRRRDAIEKLLAPYQQKAWAAAGGDFQNPTVPEQMIQDLRTVELQVAKADMSCSSEEDLQRLKEVEKEYWSRFLRQHSVDLEQIGRSLN
jgi:hypothetical protein